MTDRIFFPRRCEHDITTAYACDLSKKIGLRLNWHAESSHSTDKTVWHPLHHDVIIIRDAVVNKKYLI